MTTSHPAIEHFRRQIQAIEAKRREQVYTGQANEIFCGEQARLLKKNSDHERTSIIVDGMLPETMAILGGAECLSAATYEQIPQPTAAQMSETAYIVYLRWVTMNDQLIPMVFSYGGSGTSSLGGSKRLKSYDVSLQFAAQGLVDHTLCQSSFLQHVVATEGIANIRVLWSKDSNTFSAAAYTLHAEGVMVDYFRHIRMEDYVFSDVHHIHTPEAHQAFSEVAKLSELTPVAGSISGLNRASPFRQGAHTFKMFHAELTELDIDEYVQLKNRAMAAEGGKCICCQIDLSITQNHLLSPWHKSRRKHVCAKCKAMFNIDKNLSMGEVALRRLRLAGWCRCRSPQ